MATLDQPSPTEQLLEELFVNPPVRPLEAGFRGEVRIQNGTTFRFKRGPYVPTTRGFRNELLWVSPPDSPPMFMWCDSNGQLYELKFHPYHTNTTPPTN